ncbi:MAG: antibiotic biosynthesis monooxygenase [Pikeienuella sp.]
MAPSFIHIGKFIIDPKDRGEFIAIMKNYEKTATQNGLDHSHVVEDEKAPGAFMHVTVWARRDDWVAIEKTEAHRTMHDQREKLLIRPMEHDFICGRIEI